MDDLFKHYNFCLHYFIINLVSIRNVCLTCFNVELTDLQTIMTSIEHIAPRIEPTKVEVL